MNKRAFVVHGWDGCPKEERFPWLTKELEAEGFNVFVPQLPDAGSPRIQKWVPELAEIVGAPDRNTYFVGHSFLARVYAGVAILLVHFLLFTHA